MSDPINPAHYAGTACAQIGERLTGNSYQVLKYNWRLGKKDEPLVEVRKSLWYLDREILIASQGFEPMLAIPPDDFFYDLLVGVEDSVVNIAWQLINWNRHGDKVTLDHLRADLVNLEEHISGNAVQAPLPWGTDL